MNRLEFPEILTIINHSDAKERYLFENVLQPTCFQKVKLDESDTLYFDKSFQILAGKCLEWIEIEIFIFTFYLLTLLIFMIKSRF